METLLLQINLDESYFINRQSKIFLDFEILSIKHLFLCLSFSNLL